MYRNPLNPQLPLGPILPINLLALQLLQRLLALLPQHPPKDRIQPIQMRGLVQQYKELASVRVGALIRHGNNAARGVSEAGAEFVREGAAPYREAGFRVRGGRVRWGAGLDHEGGD